MTEPVRPKDTIELANASFWLAKSLDEFLRDVDPIDSLDEAAIDDLTDEEWDVVCSALSE